MAMRSKKVSKKTTEHMIWVVLTSTLVTLYFNTKIQDPFNSPKMWLLLILAAACFGPALISLRTNKINSLAKKTIFIILLFILFNLISAILTDNSYIAFFGETQRRIGFLTYLSLAIVMLFVMVRVDFNNLRITLHTMGMLGFVSAVYGFTQSQGKDFVSWNNPYNSVITTLGNPNYAAALLAMLGTICIGIALLSSEVKIIKIFYLVSSFFILYIVVLSDARQGLISFGVGLAIVLIYYFYNLNKGAGYLVVLGVLCLAAVSILGILQKGPLATLLYKSSVTIRGYYWQAGIDMFRSSPLFGVGIDSYGEYFKQYRNPQYSLNYGFDLTSTNAHNVPIQMFATGGIFVGVTYILILISIFIAALKAIMTTSDTRKPFIVIALAAWLSYISQSIVSIDNIGLTIWGWILGGILIGINSRIQNLSEGLENNSPPIRKSVESLDVIKVLVSMSLLIVSIILNSILYKSEKNAFFIRTYFQNNSNSQSQIFYEEANKTFSLQFNDPNYKMQTAAYMVNAGLKDEGLLRLRQINSDNPRNLDVLNMLAEYSEIYGLTYDAIEFRSKISVLDPWNAKNYLRLGNLYKFNGEKIKMLEIKDKILSFASNTSEGKLAAVELAG